MPSKFDFLVVLFLLILIFRGNNLLLKMATFVPFIRELEKLEFMFLDLLVIMSKFTKNAIKI